MLMHIHTHIHTYTYTYICSCIYIHNTQRIAADNEMRTSEFESTYTAFKALMKQTGPSCTFKKNHGVKGFQSVVSTSQTVVRVSMSVSESVAVSVYS